jgi:hypothetical protein
MQNAAKELSVVITTERTSVLYLEQPPVEEHENAYRQQTPQNEPCRCIARLKAIGQQQSKLTPGPLKQNVFIGTRSLYSSAIYIPHSLANPSRGFFQQYNEYSIVLWRLLLIVSHIFVFLQLENMLRTCLHSSMEMRLYTPILTAVLSSPTAQ